MWSKKYDKCIVCETTERKHSGNGMCVNCYKRNYKKLNRKSRKPLIEIGDKYNRLTAIRFDYKDKRYQQFWLFECDCGNKKVIRAERVKSEHAKSCGCLQRELISGAAITHGMAKTRIYNSWISMKQRCLNKNNPRYEDYGERGIVICKEWLNSFENFYKDMGKMPKNKTLERIDNNKGYYKENCCWATQIEQNNNTRKNHFITFRGKPLWKWSYDIAKKVLDDIVVIGVDCQGGRPRSESVDIGLKKIKGKVVVILDAARPLVTKKQIEIITEAGWKHKSATFYMPLRDTTYDIKERKYYRDSCVALQVPQAFRAGLLRVARTTIKDKYIYDDTVLMNKAYDIKPKLILGGPNLHKLTFEEDLKILEVLC